MANARNERCLLALPSFLMSGHTVSFAVSGRRVPPGAYWARSREKKCGGSGGRAHHEAAHVTVLPAAATSPPRAGTRRRCPRSRRCRRCCRRSCPRCPAARCCSATCSAPSARHFTAPEGKRLPDPAPITQSMAICTGRYEPSSVQCHDLKRVCWLDGLTTAHMPCAHCANSSALGGWTCGSGRCGQGEGAR